MVKSIKQIIEEVKSDALEYIESQRDLLKLKAIEKGVPLGVRGVYALMMAILLGAILLFLCVTIGFLFAMIFASSTLGAYDTVSAAAAGFGCLTGLLLLIALILFFSHGAIFRSMEKKIISAELDKMEQQEHDEAGEKRRQAATVTVVADIADAHSTTPTSSEEPHTAEVPLFAEEEQSSIH